MTTPVTAAALDKGCSQWKRPSGDRRSSSAAADQHYKRTASSLTSRSATAMTPKSNSSSTGHCNVTENKTALPSPSNSLSIAAGAKTTTSPATGRSSPAVGAASSSQLRRGGGPSLLTRTVETTRTVTVRDGGSDSDSKPWRLNKSDGSARNRQDLQDNVTHSFIHSLPTF